MDGYTQVICEKPDAARRVAEALSGGTARIEQIEGTTDFRFMSRGEDDAVASTRGHVYGVSDPSGERTVYPVFDVEWYPSDLTEDGAGAARRILAVKKLAAGASRFVNACDFDVEGETIGFNLLRYACGGKEKGALRARFSTLTTEDLLAAFAELKPQEGEGLARAGRARHAIDFVWGVNLSRALSQAPLGSGHRYRTVSAGRVQGPTLGFLVQREREIREFVPVPYWRVSGTFDRGGRRLSAGYAEERVESKATGDQVSGDCLGRDATVTSVRRSVVQLGPPVPFDIGDLQKEAFRAFGYTPSRTLQIAERLYLGALISYPRTGSQKLPPSINYRGIIAGIGKLPAYSSLAEEILKAGPRPVQGAKADPAHPAIHPTGERPRRPLDSSEASVFDLVVRRFLAAFGPPARRDLVDITLAVGEHEFRLTGGRTVFPGWMKCYGRYVGFRDAELPPVSEGDELRVVDVLVEEKSSQGPPRYNQSTLLEKMEKEGIGTKATRAETITTLVGRGYVAGDRMEVTELGLSVVETLEKYVPSIISTGLTKDIEEKLEAIEGGTDEEAALLRETVRSLAEQLAALRADEEEVGKEIDSAVTTVVAKASALGGCPVCKTGELRIIRSKATRKRFAGCSNYPACRNSAPLPQKGTIRAAAKRCQRCGWPVVLVVGGRRPWSLCVNPGCPGKRKP